MTRDPLSARGPLITGYSAAAAMLLLLGGWGATATLSGAVVAPGRMEVDVNRQVVQNLQGGVVREILVRDGAEVSAGQALLRLDDTQPRSELNALDAQLGELQARRARLVAERDGADLMPPLPADARVLDAQYSGQIALFAARRESLDQQDLIFSRQILEIEDRIEGLVAQHAALGAQLLLVVEERANQEKLMTRGLTEAGRVLALRREEARLQGELARLEAEASAARSRVSALEAERGQIHRKRHEEAIADLRDLEFRELELAERRAALSDRVARLEVTSPVAGIVHGSTVHSLGAVVQPGEALMFVVPRDRPLVASVRVAPGAIDQIYEGQIAMLRLASADPRRTPELDGEVVEISADAFTGSDGVAPYYLVRIAPDVPRDKTGAWSGVLPGMSVDAFIKTREQTPLSYLTRPLTDYFSRAFREG